MGLRGPTRRLDGERDLLPQGGWHMAAAQGGGRHSRVFLACRAVPLHPRETFRARRQQAASHRVERLVALATPLRRRDKRRRDGARTMGPLGDSGIDSARPNLLRCVQASSARFVQKADTSTLNGSDLRADLGPLLPIQVCFRLVISVYGRSAMCTAAEDVM